MLFYFLLNLGILGKLVGFFGFDGFYNRMIGLIFGGYVFFLRLFKFILNIFVIINVFIIILG